VKLSPGGEILCSPLHSSKQKCSPQGDKISPLGVRGEVENGPQYYTFLGMHKQNASKKTEIVYDISSRSIFYIPKKRRVK
jgi:hypothetical protein